MYQESFSLLPNSEFQLIFRTIEGREKNCKIDENYYYFLRKPCAFIVIKLTILFIYVSIAQ